MLRNNHEIHLATTLKSVRLACEPEGTWDCTDNREMKEASVREIQMYFVG